MDKPAISKPPGTAEAERSRQGEDRRRTLRAEALGLIVIALAILLYIILRYGAHLNWSAR